MYNITVKNKLKGKQNMNFLINKLKENEKFKQYLEDIKNKQSPINISGLSDVAKSYIIAGTATSRKKTIFIVTYNEIQAKKLKKDLEYFLTDNKETNIVYFPKKEISSYDYVSQSKDLPFERIEALNQIVQKKANIIITTIEALMQNMPEKDVIYKNIVSFQVGKGFETPNNKQSEKQDLKTLKNILVQLGYERNELVEAQGQFSIRGGIVDIGLSDKQGIRIEFWGDEVDSIRTFQIASQRSNEMLNNIVIYPAHEYIIEKTIETDESVLDENLEEGVIPLYEYNIEEICNRIEEKYLENEKELSDEQKRNIQSDIEKIKNGEYISRIDKYFNEFYPKQETFLQYIPKDCLVFFDEMNKIGQRRENIVIDNNNLIKSLTEKERFIPEAIQNISENKLELETDHQTIYINTNASYSNKNKYEFNTREVNIYKSELDLLTTDIKKWIKEKKEIILLPGNEKNIEKLTQLLKEKEIEYTLIKDEKDTKTTSNCIIYHNKNSKQSATSVGFESYDLKIIVVSLIDAFEQEIKKKKASNTFKQAEKIVFADLKQGDYVVHRSHGIGQFIGVNTITADNVTKDYIKIKYKNDDMLYVPTNSLDNVRKYIGGGEDTAPKLSRLGSKEWENTKAKVKNNLRVIAKDLIELYAKRQQIKGFAFSKDTEWQKQFEENFPYQETEDQLRCIEEVKKDMEQEKPMDRLLCGDVGYGKTEVAIRAAFKAVMDQKQVAYLVPTTVLANQQYEEFKKRMSDFAIKVELLNRFRTKKEQEETVKKLKLGEVDVVIGTHRILSNDVQFKDLGLLIIDEEHRFGVKDKEKIKQLKNSVDVLTMTATPIPRTLHMSIVGVRDMSVIYEPPHNRRPVQTYVVEYDEEMVREAITREIERGGQIFYLYNNVEGIERKAMHIQELVPEAKVEFAHGKMSGRQLESIMEEFINKEINVLVCTTILESGIDIPNANTIIVENADKLGLAQLYQIRGRVGRSDKQAYAFIMYRRDKLLTEIADKRLKAIKEFTEFGSGFKIAMRDLEIRGAGSLLGEMQHGHMEQVGYDTYCKLLDEVVKETKGIIVEEEKEVQIDINISSYIPDEYIEGNSQKIEIYQNIALCRTEEDIQNVIDEIIDRYGVMPKELENLIEIARIKELAKEANVIKISEKMESVVFYLDKSKYNPEIIDKLIKKYELKIKFSSGIEPYITLRIKHETDEQLIKEIKEFLHSIKI